MGLGIRTYIKVMDTDAQMFIVDICLMTACFTLLVPSVIIKKGNYCMKILHMHIHTHK